jgi:hypothetical protein
VKLLDVVRDVRRHLEENGRLSLRMLRRQFELDDEALEEVIEELVEVQRVAKREGNALAWSGNAAAEPRGSQVATPSAARDPRSYTPKHLVEKILTSRSALEGERKQVTVLFADVKGSMDLAEQLDPEAWHKILDRFSKSLPKVFTASRAPCTSTRATASWPFSAPPSPTRTTRGALATQRYT